MKILSVALENIHSLNGKHSIRFDTPPLSEAAVFAIVGPTGAGKTTILDAIAVGLYGNVPRHSKTKTDDIMTRRTGFCWAEVEFEADGKKYRSRWSLQRARGKGDGNTQGAKMTLYELFPEEKQIEEGISKVPLAVEKITGLGYEQFTRSVILPQGNFAAFLKSDKNERGKLLENITGGEIFRTISIKSFERAKTEEIKLNELLAATKHINLLSEPQVVEYQGLIAQKTEEITHWEAQRKVAQERKQRLDNLEQLRQKQHQQIQNLQTAQDQYDALLPNRQRLEQHQKAEIHRTDIDEVDKLFKEIEKLQEDIAQNQREWQKTSKEKEAAWQLHVDADKAFNQLNSEVERAKPIIDKAIDLRHQKTAQETLQTNYKEELDRLEQQKKDHISQLETQQSIFKTNTATLQKTEQWLLEHAKFKELSADLPLLDNQNNRLQEERSKFANLQQSQKDAQQSLADADTQCQQRREALSVHQAQLQQHQDKLAQCRKDAADLPQRMELEQQISLRQEQISQIKQLIDFSKTYTGQQKELQELIQQHAQQEQEHQKLQGEIAVSETQLANDKTLLDAYAAAQLREAAIAKYEQDRQRLQPEHPCPLCGALHHPYADYQPNTNQTTQDYNQQKEKVAAQEVNLVNLKTNKARIITEIEERRKRGKKVKETCESQKQQFADNLQANGSPADITVDSIEQLDSLQQYAEQLQSKADGLRQAIAQVSQFDKDLKIAEENVQKSEKAAQQAQSDLQLAQQDHSNIAQDLQRLNSELDSQRKALKSQATSIVASLQKYADAGKIITTEQLLRIDEILRRLEEKSKEFAQQTELSRTTQGQITIAKTLCQQLEKQLDDDNRHIKAATINLDNSTKELSHLNQQYNELTQNMQRKDPSQERERLDKALNEARNSKEEAKLCFEQLKNYAIEFGKKVEEYKVAQGPIILQYDTLLPEIIAKTRKSGFDSLCATKNALLDPQEVNELQTTQNKAEQDLNHAQKTHDATAAELENLSANIAPHENSDDLSNEMEKYKKQIDNAHRETGIIQEQLAANERKKQDISDQQKRINDQEKEFERWASLNKLIGSADGSKFSRFAQSLTLDHLVTLANQHLSLLSDRYHIQQSHNNDEEPSLELEIKDLYMLQNVRSMRSLSGGETFLVSLALALGLSDIAGRRSPIKSLFIDEGFGTLDESTLRMAISTLESLQAQGRTVGIVSHVKDLQNSISTRIEVIRQGSGMSTLRIVNSY